MAIPEYAILTAEPLLSLERSLPRPDNVRRRTTAELLDTPVAINTFVEDEAGEIFLAHYSSTDGLTFHNGQSWRLRLNWFFGTASNTQLLRPVDRPIKISPTPLESLIVVVPDDPVPKPRELHRQTLPYPSQGNSPPVPQA